MNKKNKKIENRKETLHPRNRHQGRYDFKQLIGSCGDLAPYVAANSYGDLSIDFANPMAVKMLNRALLIHFYQLNDWDIPDGFLCPPIPGRADYIHSIADLLAEDNLGVIPRGKGVKLLDVGVGANCIYPIIGQYEYGWDFVGSDINHKALQSAEKIVSLNPSLQGAVECRLQQSSSDIFNGIIQEEEQFDITLCNPPFHRSAEEASAGSRRKVRNLSGKSAHSSSKPQLNFGGQRDELWCKGGEVTFVSKMVRQSAEMASHCLWFSSLVSKKENLAAIYKSLKKVNPSAIRTVEMAQGQKVSRFVAWSFKDDDARQAWANQRWSITSGHL